MSNFMPGSDGNFLEGIGAGIENFFTGNLDFEREQYLMNTANAFSASQAQINRDFQERMANSAYQRAVDDMRRAGLNPALAYQQGGAYSPSGSSASSASAHAGKSGQAFGAFLTTLLGSAFKVATTSMMSEAKVVSDLYRANSAYRIANLNNDERFYRDESWRNWYDDRGRRR